MKSLSVMQYTIRQNLLSNLLNTSSENQTDVTKNKIHLLNNAICFCLPDGFDQQSFDSALTAYIIDSLGFEVESLLDDSLYQKKITSKNLIINFIKKNSDRRLIFMFIQNYLFIDKIDLSKSDFNKILNFVEEFILSLYPTDIIKKVNINGRYIEKAKITIRPFLADKLEENEQLLALLSAKSIVQCKDEQAVNNSEHVFYLLTTQNSYLLAFNKNYILIYFQEFNNSKFEITSKLFGLDVVTCQDCKFNPGVDNDYLFDEIKKVNQAVGYDKIVKIAAANYNFAYDNGDISSSYQYLNKHYEFTANYTSAFFSAIIQAVIEFKNQGKVNQNTANKLFQNSEMLFSVEDSFKIIKSYLEDFKLKQEELFLCLISFMNINLLENSLKDYKSAIEKIVDLFCKIVKEDILRGIFYLTSSKCLFLANIKDLAKKYSEIAFDYFSNVNFVDYIPDNLNNYLGFNNFRLSCLSILSDLEQKKNSYGDYILRKLVEYPTNSKFAEIYSDLNLNSKAEKARVLLSLNNNLLSKVEYLPNKLETLSKFSKINSQYYLLKEIANSKNYRTLNNFVCKIPCPNTEIIKSYAEAADKEKYPTLFEISEKLNDFFAFSTPIQLLIFRGDKATGFFSFPSEKPFIAIGYNHLDKESDLYLTDNQLMFALSREYFKLKMDFSRFFVLDDYKKNHQVKFLEDAKQFSLVEDVLEKFSKLYNEDENFYINSKLEFVNSVLEILANQQSISKENIKNLDAELIKRMMIFSADRFALGITNDFIDSLIALIKISKDININRTLQEQTLFSLLNNPNFFKDEIILRLKSLLSFYISDTYNELKKNFEKK